MTEGADTSLFLGAVAPGNDLNAEINGVICADTEPDAGTLAAFDTWHRIRARVAA